MPARYYHIPARLAQTRDFSPVPPADLEQFFPIAEKVARYRFTEDEANFLFQDNVAVHTKRLVNYLRNLTLPEFLDSAEIERMLWLHDIPEAIVNETRGSDYVTHEKLSDAQFGQDEDERELRKAQEVFSPEDYVRFHVTEFSKDILNRADWWNEHYDRNGIFAKMLDYIDGRNMFIDVVSDWIMSDDYLTNSVLPPRGPFILCLQNTFQPWIKSFDVLPDERMRGYMLDFISAEGVAFCRERFQPTLERLPPDIREMYEGFLVDFSE
jgi:hypothetical protein